MNRTKLRYILFVFLCAFVISCSGQEASSPSIQGSDKSYTTHVAAGDFAPGQLEAHYAKHGYQFGNISQEEYLQNARALLNAPADNDVLEKTRSDGDVLRYRVSTGEFAVMTGDGRIRTYFKTDHRYWLRQ